MIILVSPGLVICLRADHHEGACSGCEQWEPDRSVAFLNAGCQIGYVCCLGYGNVVRLKINYLLRWRKCKILMCDPQHLFPFFLLREKISVINNFCMICIWVHLFLPDSLCGITKIISVCLTWTLITFIHKYYHNSNDMQFGYKFTEKRKKFTDKFNATRINTRIWFQMTPYKWMLLILSLWHSYVSSSLTESMYIIIPVVFIPTFRLKTYTQWCIVIVMWLKKCLHLVWH